MTAAAPTYSALAPADCPPGAETTYLPGTDVVRAGAEAVGVCVRPVLRRVTDTLTGETTTVPIPCGSTRASKCPTCADKARRLRIHQCREGWHLTEDATRTPGLGEDPVEDEVDEDQDDTDHGEQGTGRRVRSTRRRSDVPDLPWVPMADTTLGRIYTDPRTGRTYRPSMFLTLTLPSYGPIVPGAGVPRRPRNYDYRRAALDAMHFPRLVDRFWQNLRRVAGYRVQYFSAVEGQRRLAPHLHAAVRGTIPRATIRAVAAATTAAIWWPPADDVVYDDPAIDAGHGPVWDAANKCYLDPTTGVPLRSWDQALDDLDAEPHAAPMHTLRFGDQVDVKGILGGTEDSDRAVRYLCKYLTKAVATTYTDQAEDPNAWAVTERQAHVDRLHAWTRILPCSPRCGNWLRYGITPKDPGPGLVPGRCPAPGHNRENAGLGGRRCLVSRQWSGKTLTPTPRRPRRCRPGSPHRRRLRTRARRPARRCHPHRRITPLPLVRHGPGGTPLRRRHHRQHPPGPALARTVRQGQGAHPTARVTTRGPCALPFGKTYPQRRGLIGEGPWMSPS
ncbi:MAG TPA: replication initiator [Dermatophilaceae bacterium]|nr:replication initiator [Dermatophilaceae bacterium]